MTLSKAKKQRKKQVREGRLNPEINRSPYAQLDLRTRKTKTKKDNLYRIKHKNRLPQKGDNDSFLCFYRPCTTETY
ncbi:hypothetical protein [Oceanobacillus halophilus]|uniref:Uncharacterized protein n=1 Tax=Oceanobacillus halophilus TaxID=930130 RepID=A0A494ZWQ1_9BACI|nr:hypothetical protein [Oceanobacillus halophilus]RKQ30787.1 hypothetical protein D8M06_15325 [Oceanobacillus halophilus]